MIPFNKPVIIGRELEYINHAVDSMHLAGDGNYTRLCHQWIEEELGISRALLTTSCTSALEMAALLYDIGEGDEVILPSYTFVTTANAFVRQGATPVFVDIRKDTLNLDENLVEAAITPRTKVIVPVHYAGVGCDMEVILDVAASHGVGVVEDAAQAVGATWQGRPLGGIGDLGCFSFHETKNFICGEGGALLVNRPDMMARAEIIREKGTDRSQFLRGQVDKYTWVDCGSSFLPSELNAAFLYAQFEGGKQLLQRRMELWEKYRAAFSDLRDAGRVSLPSIPEGAGHNAHMFYLICGDSDERDRLIRYAAEQGVQLVFHYVPLHSSPMGRDVGRTPAGTLPVTDDLSGRLVRLPLYHLLSEADQEKVIDTVLGFFSD